MFLYMNVLSEKVKEQLDFKNGTIIRQLCVFSHFLGEFVELNCDNVKGTKAFPFILFQTKQSSM